MDADWFEKRLKAVDKTQSHLAAAIGRDRSIISRIFSGNRKMALDDVGPFAEVLEVTYEEVLKRAGLPNLGRGGGPVQLGTIAVVGDVAAGEWRDAIQWDVDDAYTVNAPADNRYPGIKRYGLRICGPSMNNVYPEGSVVICVLLDDLARMPAPGERVVCEQTRSDGLVEATIKEVVLDEDHRVWLSPRSTDPRFQTPIMTPLLAHKDEQSGYWEYRHIDGDDAEDESIKLRGLVTGSYREE